MSKRLAVGLQRRLQQSRYATRATQQQLFSSDAVDSDGVKDFFATFDLPRRFHIDEVVLKENYRNLMKELHPDKQISRLNSEATVNDASRVTHAYHTLKKRHTRASYLMELMGYELTEDSGSLLPPAFLMEMMELRESLEEAVKESELRTILEETNEKIAEVGTSLQTALDGGDHDIAQRCAGMLQYYHRVSEAAISKLDSED